ncbi:hypothetical protein BGW38_000639 [Lunasporangiospora selenospora]|uniref:Rap-GAP domain-containing protein n=1 Tax=Lunasporangiospora selenospora TaxID=979761 RepID=A0A9P6FVT8_9FUNG|nr:hypothetical protein BGW38_000639 [Lunasporangiospora selenospora]
MAHMRWAMEVLGQGFALPLEELSIAQETTQLYSQWLFEPQMRPQAFREATGTADEQALYQTIFHHYSLLFQVRSGVALSPQPPQLQYHRHSTMPFSGVHSSSGSSSSTHSTPPPQVALGVLIQRHIELCKKVLTVLTMAGRQLGSSFSDETWEVLLKVVLGITDSLLREHTASPHIPPSPPLSPEHVKMSDDLCEHLLRVLFELWLRSNIRQVPMWDILKQCFNGWTHRLPVLHQWAASALGLCQRVVRLLYGPGQGTDLVNLAVGGYNIGLDLQADFALYAWHRMIYLLRSPAMLSSTNCLAAVNGMGKMVETFLLVGASNPSAIPGSPPLPSTPTDIFSSSSIHLGGHSPSSKSGRHAIPYKPTSPDGNTIMHMFGAWLFDVTSLPSPDPATTPYTTSHWQGYPPYPIHNFYEAQASAFGVLCRIFSKPQPPSRPFLRIYTERFYEALSIGLRSETSLPTILAHSAELFTSELEGVRMMVPDYVVGIRMALSGQVRVSTPFMSIEKQRQVLEDLHLAALKVAGCIMCLPNHFEKVELKEGWTRGLSKGAGVGFSGGMGGSREDKEILAQLIRVLYTEEPAKDGSGPGIQRFTTLKYYILEMLLNCLETETSSFNLRYLLHLIEVYVYEDVAFCPGLVGVVVKTIQERIMTVQVPVEVALCAFDVLIGCAGLYEYVRRDSKSCARELVLALCRYIDSLLSNHTTLSNTHLLVVRAYECMLQWILAGQWIVGDQDCHLAVISSISNGIHIIERVEEQEASVVPPKPQQEKRRWGGVAAGNVMISAVGAPLSISKPSSGAAAKLFQVNSKYPGPIKILNQELKKEKGNRKNRSTSSSMSGHVRPNRPDLVLIQHSAELAMTLLSNQLGHYPVWTDDIGPSRMSTLWNDIALNRNKLENLCKSGELESLSRPASMHPLDQNFLNQRPRIHYVVDVVGPVQYFLLDRRVILGCCEVDEGGGPERNSFVDEHGPFAVVTMRDSSGRNSWKVRMSRHNQQDQQRTGDRRSIRSRVASQASTVEADRENRREPDLEEEEEGGEGGEGGREGEDSEDDDTIPPGPSVLCVEAADEKEIGLQRYERPPRATHTPDGATDVEDSSEPVTLNEETGPKSAFGPGEVLPEKSVELQSSPTGSNAFRVLLAQMGYLSLENRSRIVPLHLSDNLLKELQFLDSLKERDCISVSVYYAQSGDIDYGELVLGPASGLSKDFSRFLDCLGWPIQVETHGGYLGYLNKEICQTTPYYADRNCEVIFHVPYLMRPSDPESPTVQDHRLVDQFRTTVMRDQVAIVWVEERERMVNLLPLIDQEMMIYLLIHPLEGDSAGGLFWIRILVQSANTTAGSVRLAANPLMIGPLADGMLVSRHALGSLVRNTAISADKACRLMTDSFTEPSTARARYIQEMLQMHSCVEPERISEFYRTMFAA